MEEILIKKLIPLFSKLFIDGGISMLYNILAGFLKLNLICGSGGMADAQDSDSCPFSGGVGSSPIFRSVNPLVFKGFYFLPFSFTFYYFTYNSDAQNFGIFKNPFRIIRIK